MAAAAAAMEGERLVAGRTQRVAVGDDLQVVEVQLGDPWPPDARARLDVLLRTGHVIRFESDGTPDKRSAQFVRRLGIAPPPSYPARTWAQRAQALAQTAVVNGRRFRVYPGRVGVPADCFILEGRAYSVRSGCPDDPAAAEAFRGDAGGASEGSPRRGSTPKKRAPKKPAADGETPAPRRRRKPE